MPKFVYKLPRCANSHVQGRESNLLGIKPYTSEGTSRRSWYEEVEYEDVRSFVGLADRFCLASYYLFFPLHRRRRRILLLLLFPPEARSGPSFPPLRERKELAESASRSRLAYAPRSETPLNKSARECRRVYQFTNRARSSTVEPTRNDP